MNFKEFFHRLQSKLWFRIFINVTAIFLVFVLVLAITDSTLLVQFYTHKQKGSLAECIDDISRLDLEDESAVTETLSAISDTHHYEIEIYNRSGQILYTTYGSQMMDYFTNNQQNFSMLHENLQIIDRENLGNGTVYIHGLRPVWNNEYLLCYREITSGIFAEVRIQKQLIDASAATANEFILMVASICFVLSVLWVFFFSKRFSKPIARMNEITRQLSNLDFSQRVEESGHDELGQLAHSVNEMSDSLENALQSLRESNAKLRDEIELERQLDVMRKGFVANVSHELKTPISIISGYAEGLKLNINADSREKYCDIIMDESQRMNRLVLSILELSRYESGSITANRQNFDLRLPLEKFAERIFKDTDFTVRIEAPEDLLINADPIQFEEVLKAYLENAKAHVNTGGTVTLSATEKDGKIRLSVHNTGSHLDPETMPQIWQSFYRGETSHKRESNRFGLGLSIVSAIAALHRTDCGVYNTDNGVCFWIEFEKGDAV